MKTNAAIERRRKDLTWVESEEHIRKLTIALVDSEQQLKHLEHVVAQSKKLATLGQLTAGVAHEINNPIAVILGFAESLFSRTAVGDALRQPYESIIREALRCTHLVQHLLAFSRNNGSKIEPDGLSEVVEEAMVLTETLAKTRRVVVVRSLAPGLPMIPMDRTQIQQAVINLCTNAMDAMPKGGTLTVATALYPGGVELRVSDTGTGVPIELRERIFEPFYTTKAVGKGTGLGLSLIADIARKHKAVLDLQSELGRGSTFSIRFPVATL